MKVYYMNGAGNDFMVIDARGLTLDYPALARKCCAVTGADGFMATDVSDKADFRLHFYNSDGTYFVTQISSMNQRENSPEAGSLVKRRAVEAVAPSIVSE